MKVKQQNRGKKRKNGGEKEERKEMEEGERERGGEGGKGGRRKGVMKEPILHNEYFYFEYFIVYFSISTAEL